MVAASRPQPGSYGSGAEVGSRQSRPLRTITRPWEDWRAVIAVLRQKGIPYMLDHADHLERLLEQHGPGESTVRLSLTDDVFLRSYNWARVQLSIALPPD
jgi:hypothetical protein